MTDKGHYPLLWDFCRENFIECKVGYYKDLPRNIVVCRFDFTNTLTEKRFYCTFEDVFSNACGYIDNYILAKLKKSGIAELPKPEINYIKEEQRLMNENRRPIFCYDDIAKNIKNKNKFDIEKVVFNDPATIVFWKDGTKTVVKCQEGDVFDKEKGLAMAITKRALGDKGNYNEILKKYLKE